jgi:hypothetical protein
VRKAVYSGGIHDAVRKLQAEQPSALVAVLTHKDGRTHIVLEGNTVSHDRGSVTFLS